MNTICLQPGSMSQNQEAIRAAETSIEGTSIYMHNPSGKVAKAYENLTKEVIANEN